VFGHSPVRPSLRSGAAIDVSELTEPLKQAHAQFLELLR
jgi:hypothetical protein